MSKFSFDKIVNHAKVSGFVFPCSEIYGGLLLIVGILVH